MLLSRDKSIRLKALEQPKSVARPLIAVGLGLCLLIAALIVYAATSQGTPQSEDNLTGYGGFGGLLGAVVMFVIGFPLFLSGLAITVKRIMQ